MENALTVAVVTTCGGIVVALITVGLPLLRRDRPPEDDEPTDVDGRTDVPVLLRTLALIDAELDEARQRVAVLESERMTLRQKIRRLEAEVRRLRAFGGQR